MAGLLKMYIRCGNAAEVARLLKEADDDDVADGKLFRLAALAGNKEVVQVLVDDTRVPCDWAVALTAAAGNGHDSVVELALSHVSDMKAVVSACLCAIENNKLPTLKLVGKKVPLRSLYYIPQLETAARCSRDGVILRYLLEVAGKLVSGAFVVDEAVKASNYAALELLIADDNVDPNKAEDRSPIFHAIANRDSRAVRILLKSRKLIVNFYVPTGSCSCTVPLQYAVLHRGTRIVKMLLRDPRCNPNAVQLPRPDPFYIELFLAHKGWKPDFRALAWKWSLEGSYYLAQGLATLMRDKRYPIPEDIYRQRPIHEHTTTKELLKAEHIAAIVKTAEAFLQGSVPRTTAAVSRSFFQHRLCDSHNLTKKIFEFVW